MNTKKTFIRPSVLSLTLNEFHGLGRWATAELCSSAYKKTSMLNNMLVFTMQKVNKIANEINKDSSKKEVKEATAKMLEILINSNNFHNQYTVGLLDDRPLIPSNLCLPSTPKHQIILMAMVRDYSMRCTSGLPSVNYKELTDFVKERKAIDTIIDRINEIKFKAKMMIELIKLLERI